MDKKELENLQNELNELSEDAEWNKERMKEIAQILVEHYLYHREERQHKDNIDVQKMIDACNECYANRHKWILQHCRTCVYWVLKKARPDKD